MVKSNILLFCWIIVFIDIISYQYERRFFFYNIKIILITNESTNIPVLFKGLYIFFLSIRFKNSKSKNKISSGISGEKFNITCLSSDSTLNYKFLIFA